LKPITASQKAILAIELLTADIFKPRQKKAGCVIPDAAVSGPSRN